jgi:hypothetical protein
MSIKSVLKPTSCSELQCSHSILPPLGLDFAISKTGRAGSIQVTLYPFSSSWHVNNQVPDQKSVMCFGESSEILLSQKSSSLLKLLKSS